jgi:sulfur-oxidizing protein SoxX
LQGRAADPDANRNVGALAAKCAVQRQACLPDETLPMAMTNARDPPRSGRRHPGHAPRRGLRRALGAALAAGALGIGAGHAADGVAAFTVAGDGIDAPLAGAVGDAARGRALILARDPANCILCHAVPDPDVRFSGNVGPPLEGVATRLTPAQLRLRIVDSTRLDPRTVMPAYYRIAGLSRVATPYRDKPILTPREIEDLVAYLSTLR